MPRLMALSGGLRLCIHKASLPVCSVAISLMKSRIVNRPLPASSAEAPHPGAFYDDNFIPD
jgi:hypothetical protein